MINVIVTAVRAHDAYRPGDRYEVTQARASALRSAHLVVWDSPTLRKSPRGPRKA